MIVMSSLRIIAGMPALGVAVVWWQLPGLLCQVYTTWFQDRHDSLSSSLQIWKDMACRSLQQMSFFPANQLNQKM